MKNDFIIVGSGSIGMAIALKLSQALPNCKVVVIDNNHHGSASRAAGAMLGCFAEVTKYTFMHEAASAKFDMMYLAHKVWPAWMEELTALTGTHIKYTRGTHVILNSQGGALDDDNYEAILTTLDKYNEPYDVVHPKEIINLSPTKLARPLRTIYLPNEGSIDSNQYLEVLHNACLSQGVRFVSGLINSKIEQERDSFCVTIDKGEIKGGTLILAAGSSTSILLDCAELDVPVMPILSGVGVAMTLSRTVGKVFRHNIRTANRAGSCGLHLVPLNENLEYIGATNVINATPEYIADLGMSHFLTQCAMEQLDQSLYYSRIESWRVGNRPVSLDTLPLIGKSTLGDIYIASGTYRDGFHCSPIIAESIVNEIVARQRTVSEWFKPERKPIEIMTQEQSINEFAMQAVSGAYENWMRLPYYLDDGDLFESARKLAIKLYKQFDTDIALHPDLILFLTSQDTDTTIVKNYLNVIDKQ